MNIFNKLKLRIQLIPLFKKSWNWLKGQAKYVHMLDDNDRDILVSLIPIDYHINQVNEPVDLYADDISTITIEPEEYIVHAEFKLVPFTRKIFGKESTRVTIDRELLDKNGKWLLKYLEL